MIIACPKCFTRYNLPTASLGGTGRVVKCSKCAHKWHQEPPQVKTQQPETPPQSPEETSQPQATNVPALRTPRSQKILPLWVGMALGGVATLLVLGIGILIKDPFIRALPALASIVSSQDPTEHLKADAAYTQGLTVENIQRDIVEEDGFTTYIISGEVVNTNMNQANVPTLRVSLLDEQGNLVDEWRVQAQKKNLNPGEKSPWICYFYNPPLAQISEYRVTFVTSDA